VPDRTTEGRRIELVDNLKVKNTTIFMFFKKNFMFLQCSAAEYISVLERVAKVERPADKFYFSSRFSEPEAIY
jgi:hypothetical protein